MKLKPVTVTVAVLATTLGFAATAMAAGELPEVTVEAGQTQKTVVGRSRSTNAPIELVTVDYHVRYSDLDLHKHADVLRFHSRVETAARDACRQLDELYPIEKPQIKTCTHDAIQGASQQVQAAVAAAGGQDDDTH